MTALDQAKASRPTRSGARQNAAQVYRVIRASSTELAHADPFSAHVFACALTVAICEAADLSDSVSASFGLDRGNLFRLMQNWAPEAMRYVDPRMQPEHVEFDEEESQLRALLERYRADRSETTDWLIAIVTRRAMAPGHLWQDLGLFDRAELGRLLERWFPELARRNVAKMKWKKFFYRSLCELEGFTLCAAPTCRECADFDDCFGEESGEGLLARLANVSSAPRRS